ncbi:MAG: glycosyltransferase family 25 protein [Hyphomonadaceae bacterium]|nr:glycosyltransferase family 25 protein [Hyphomonadaceae bacterium]
MFSTVVINLDRDPDRLDYMRQQLEREGVTFERFAAILGAAMPSDLRGYFAPEEDGTGFLSNGELGCYASHLAVYEAIADGRIASPALVLEDDVKVPENFRALMDQILQAAPADWDLIRLSSPAKRAYFTIAELMPPYALVRYSISSGSNGAILVSQAGAKKFTDRSDIRDAPIDQDNRQLWRFNLNLYGVAPEPIRGNSLETSTIDALGQTRVREDRARQVELRRKRKLGRRHGWNIGQVGVVAWAASECVSVIAALIGKKARPGFLARSGRWLAALAKPSV